MGLIDYAIIFGSTFFSVFLLGFNSKNVHQSRYFLAFLTSWGITAAQYFFAMYAANGGGLEFITVAGAGGSLGIVTAIYVHDKITPKLDARSKKKRLNKAPKGVSPRS